MAKKLTPKNENKSKNKANSASKPTVIVKKAAAPVKDDSKAASKSASATKDDLKNQKTPAIAVKTDAKPQTLKPAVKAKSGIKSKSKSKKNDKKKDDDDDIENDIDDDFGESEIAEYEDDLKAVEDDDEDDNLDEFSDDDDSESSVAEIFLTDSEGRRLCRVRDCDQVANVEGYCRYHYLLFWKKIQIRKVILNDDKLEKYIIALTTKYPDKFLEMIKKDLKTEKDFLSSIAELEIDESVIQDDAADDEAQSFTDEIRGTVESTAMDDDSDY
jgi:hypothetical protein